MAPRTTTKTGVRGRTAARRPAPTARDHLNDALMHFLRAIPVGHLDTRMKRVEKVLGRLQKEVEAVVTPRRRRAAGAPHRDLVGRRTPAVRLTGRPAARRVHR